VIHKTFQPENLKERDIGKTRRRWKDNIEMNHKYISMAWI